MADSASEASHSPDELGEQGCCQRRITEDRAGLKGNVAGPQECDQIVPGKILPDRRVAQAERAETARVAKQVTNLDMLAHRATAQFWEEFGYRRVQRRMTGAVQFDHGQGKKREADLADGKSRVRGHGQGRDGGTYASEERETMPARKQFERDSGHSAFQRGLAQMLLQRLLIGRELHGVRGLVHGLPDARPMVCARSSAMNFSSSSRASASASSQIGRGQCVLKERETTRSAPFAVYVDS